MRTKIKEVSGIDWFDGAVMNCKWTGPLLHDVLEKASVDIQEEKWASTHVAFACHQTATQEDEWYGASIPLPRAIDPKCGIMLALEMNGKALPPKHGAPVRVVTPGIAGARSVKWLDSITVQTTESSNYYQQHDYKILPSEADSVEKAEQWWAKVDALQDMPINSVVATPASDSTVHVDENSTVEVSGYALPSGSDGPVVGVEVSADEGKTWQVAELLKAEEEGEGDLKWAWCLWKVRVKIEKGKDRKIFSRAKDRSGNMQKATVDWNLRGVAYNAYGEASGLEVVEGR